VTKNENGGEVVIFSATKFLQKGATNCVRPVSVAYAPHRSTTSWVVDHNQIALPNQTLGSHTQSWIELDAMTPDYAWATTREHPYLAKINVHTKKVETIDMSHVGCTALVSSRNHYLCVQRSFCSRRPVFSSGTTIAASAAAAVSTATPAPRALFSPRT